MLSLPRLSAVILFTSCFVTLCIASPLHDTVSSLSVARNLEPETVKFKGKDYDAILIPFGGLHSTTHQLEDGYGPTKARAVLKVLKPDFIKSFKGEIENLKEFDQWLDDDGERAIMMKDIHFDYPKKGDRKKHLHEWIVEDHSEWLEDLNNKVETAKKTMMKAAEDIANDKGKVLSNMVDDAFFSEDLSEVSFCDLDPQYIDDLKKPEDKKFYLDNAKHNLERRLTPFYINDKVEKFQRHITEKDLY